MRDPFALTCPLCRNVTGLQLAGPALEFECSTCHVVFHLDRTSARDAAELIGRNAVNVADKGGHCSACGSVLFNGKPVTADG